MDTTITHLATTTFDVRKRRAHPGTVPTIGTTVRVYASDVDAEAVQETERARGWGSPLGPPWAPPCCTVRGGDPPWGGVGIPPGVGLFVARFGPQDSGLWTLLPKAWNGIAPAVPRPHLGPPSPNAASSWVASRRVLARRVLVAMYAETPAPPGKRMLLHDGTQSGTAGPLGPCVPEKCWFRCPPKNLTVPGSLKISGEVVPPLVARRLGAPSPPPTPNTPAPPTHGSWLGVCSTRRYVE